MSKERYVCHYQNLQQLVRLGVRVTKVHRALGFEESDWLGVYIDLNTNLRATAKNDFEKEFFKLMNNAVFGKTCENILNRVDVRLATTKKKALKLIAKPEYRRFTIFSDNMVGIHLAKTKVKMNKPSYAGVAVLELSKTLMLDFHYEYTKSKWGDRAQLLMTDTDSLVYEIQTDDFFKDIADDVEQGFDTSNFSGDSHPSGIAVGKNKKVVGLMKSETGDKIIHEFVGLRAKLYAYDTDDETTKKAKGVKKNVVESSITMEDFKRCIFDGVTKTVAMNVIRSREHTVFTEHVEKKALDANDDKRYIIPDDPEHRTLAWGHKDVPQAHKDHGRQD